MAFRFGLAFGIASIAVGVALCDPGVGFGDAGELGAAASTWGVAHPTGFPLALIWTHWVELLPFGSLAFRHALSAAFAGGLTIGVIAHLIASKTEDPRVAFVACFVAATALLGWGTTLGSFLSMEVYAPAMLVLALAMHESQIGRRPGVLGLCVGLAAATHVVALLGSIVLAIPTMRRRRGIGAFMMLGMIGSALVFYLPLASWRQPALDWGDPQTLGRFVEHLSAARIREAFADAPSRPRVFLEQLAELAPLSLPAIYAWVRVSRARVLLVLVLVDLAYGLWINPMGVPERQVGHLLGLALAVAAGLGVVAVLSDLSPSPSLRIPAIACALFLGATGARGLLRHEGAGYTVQERFEDSLLSAPPRAVVLCGTDVGCSNALLARYAVGLRPDVDVLVPQHLWEPRDRARLRTSRVELPSFASSARPEANERAAFVQRALGELVGERLGRPLESQDAIGLPHGRVAGVAVIGDEDDTWEGLLRLEALADASAPREGPARRLWARQFDQVGKLGLARGHARAATAAFRAGIELAPERAVGWSNLGVVLANAGDLAGAITATRSAVERDPQRVVAWVNLARYLAGSGDLDAARRVARQALDRGLEDPRLHELSSANPGSQP